MPIVLDHNKASKFKWECRCTESFSHSTLKNANKSKVTIKAAETIMSTDRWGPRFFEKNIFLKCKLKVKYSIVVALTGLH